MHRPSLVPLALALLAAPALCGAPSLRWKGRTYKLEALPEALPAEVGRAAGVWGEWAEDEGYRLELSDDARCLLVVSERRGKVELELELIERTLDAVDAFLPPREGSTPAAEGAAKPKAGPGRLEDFELPPLTPEVSAPRLPHQVPVLLEARDPGDYADALRMLVRKHPWLASWAEDTGASVYGLVLPHPLVGAWLWNAPDNEEWDPRNELVHRLAQLLVLDRGGQPPYWLLAGIAWNVEHQVRGAIYCFPYRAEFVGVGEHGGWSPQLKSEFGGKLGAPPTIDELASLRRGRYVDRSAGLAWGAARWLIREQPARLPAILLDLDEVRRKDGIEVRQDGSWSTRPGWEVPPEAQLEVLRRHLGRNALRSIGEAFAAGI